MFKARIFFLFLFFVTSLVAQELFNDFIDKQIEIVQEMNDINQTSEQIDALVEKQEKAYAEIVDYVLVHKEEILNAPDKYARPQFTLSKIIAINQRHNNEYALIRDKALLDSYKILQEQNKMTKSALRALDKGSLNEFREKMYELFNQNQTFMASLDKKEYKKYLDIEDNSQILKDAKKNIRRYYALLEVNVDVLKYMSLFDVKMYRLNTYYNYHILNPIMYLNEFKIIKTIDSYLSEVGLTTIKVILITLLSIFLYIARIYIYEFIYMGLKDYKYSKKYAGQILDASRKTITLMLIVLNVEIAIYIYGDFSLNDGMSKFFNIVFAFFVTVLVYRIANAIADIKLNDIDLKSKNIKNEVINISLKIANFIIFIIGGLFMLYFAGINLTAVLSGLGIGGFAIALAAKDSLSNFFGTLSILMSDTFSQGDWIVVGKEQGTVVEIGLRVTTIRTFDNALIAIPNATLANEDVKNWNKRKVGRRIKLSIGVMYNSQAEDIHKAIDEIRQMLIEHHGISSDGVEYDKCGEDFKLLSVEDAIGVKKTLFVYLDEFADSSINILVYCFSKSVVWQDWLEVKEDVLYKIMNILETNNLSFAFPSLSLYHENQLPNP